MLIVVLYDFVKSKGNIYKTAIIIFLMLFSTIKYLNFIEENNFKSRIVETAQTEGEIDSSGRDGILNTSLNFIATNDVGVGFGNYYYFVRAHVYPHNIYVETIIEIGWLAFFILVFLTFMIIVELFKLFFIYEENTTLELILLVLTVYLLLLAQFSSDIPRNILFFLTFILYKQLKLNKNVAESNNIG